MTGSRLNQKWVLITGATAGIGKACAEEFARQGANLVLTGRRQERLDSFREELLRLGDIQVQTYCFDVRDREACLSCVQDLFHPLDILINNAGLAAGLNTIDEADFDDWDRMIDTNIKGLLNMMKPVAQRMKARNSGHIINIGSLAGHESYRGGSVYCGTKHAVSAITRAAKMDLHGTGVRVSMVSPGLVQTEFSDVRFHGDTKKAKKVYEGIRPLTAHDVAEIVVFTASRPDHVNILDTLVVPVDQSSSTMVHRSE
jgi:3-hydroxy acid dehydrogenase / malonic semialdehyde reductase